MVVLWLPFCHFRRPNLTWKSTPSQKLLALQTLWRPKQRQNFSFWRWCLISKNRFRKPRLTRKSTLFTVKVGSADTWAKKSTSNVTFPTSMSPISRRQSRRSGTTWKLTALPLKWTLKTLTTKATSKRTFRRRSAEVGSDGCQKES